MLLQNVILCAISCKNPALIPVMDSTSELFSRIELLSLSQMANLETSLDWQPFQTGVEIHRFYGDGVTGPAAALLRFAPGGRIPLHEHTGYEHILILSGAQRDHSGEATTGMLVINSPGSRHSVVSENGCIVLAIYEAPVHFL